MTYHSNDNNSKIHTCLFFPDKCMTHDYIMLISVSPCLALLSVKHTNSFTSGTNNQCIADNDLNYLHVPYRQSISSAANI